MTFDEILEQVIVLLQRQGRVSYRALKRRFEIGDDDIEDLKEELIQALNVAIDEDGRPPTTITEAEAERRQLTVMFVDLVDSTRLSSELDPEDLREIVREYQRSCSEVVAKYAGNVAPFTSLQK
jgi:class 3 adenylate cyclase